MMTLEPCDNDSDKNGQETSNNNIDLANNINVPSSSSLKLLHLLHLLRPVINRLFPNSSAFQFSANKTQPICQPITDVQPMHSMTGVNGTKTVRSSGKFRGRISCRNQSPKIKNSSLAPATSSTVVSFQSNTTNCVKRQHTSDDTNPKPIWDNTKIPSMSGTMDSPSGPSKYICD